MRKQRPQITHVLNAVLFTIQNPGPVSIQAVADHLGLKYNTINTYLHRVLSVSLTRFRQKYRMNLAARLIECSKKNQHLSSIGQAVGIKNPIVFGRYFRNEFGMTPSTYQRRFGNTKNLPQKTSISDEVLTSLVKQYIRH